MRPLLKGWPIKAKETCSPHEVRGTPLNKNILLLSFRDCNSIASKFFMNDIIKYLVVNVSPNQLLTELNLLH